MRRIAVAVLLWSSSQFAVAAEADLDQCKVQDDLSYAPCKRLADQGNPDGQFGLGMLLLDGIGAQQDYDLSFKWMYKAAMQGHAPAQLQVGQAYVNGQGVDRNYEEAYAWFLVSKENRNPVAQQGIDFLNRRGVIRSDRMSAVTQRANDLYAKTTNKRGFAYDPSQKAMPVSGITEYCDMVMPTVDGVITLRRYGKPRSDAQQLMVGMTDPRAIRMMNGVIEWVWSAKLSPKEMSTYFRSQCLAQNPEVGFIFQAP